jgi:hypothetical protein
MESVTATADIESLKLEAPRQALRNLKRDVLADGFETNSGRNGRIFEKTSASMPNFLLRSELESINLAQVITS